MLPVGVRVDTVEALLPQAMHVKCASQKSQRGTKASSWESRSPQQNTAVGESVLEDVLQYFQVLMQVTLHLWDEVQTNGGSALTSLTL